MDKKNILIFPCDTEIAYEIVDSIKRNKYFKPILGCHQIDKKYMFKDIHFIPFENDKNFYIKLNNLIQEENIEFILPANDDLAYSLSHNLDKVNATVITHNPMSHEICRFKDKTYEYFSDKIPCPNIYNPINIDQSMFPIFVKPKRGQGSYKAIKIDNFKQYQFFLNSENIDDYIFCEYLPYEEFTVDCFSHNGNLLYLSVRKREKTFRGISIVTSLCRDVSVNKQVEEYARIISKELNLHGIFFFQVKYDKNFNLKLLEIGLRIPGSLALNRALGVNLVEIMLYQWSGLLNENSIIYKNDIQHDLTLFRPLNRIVRMNINFDVVYVDFDDTLINAEGKVNTDIIKFIFDSKNLNKKVCLITKDGNKKLLKYLKELGIFYIFDEVIYLSKHERKVNYMRKPSILIDDSFIERKEAMENGIPAYDPESIKLFVLE